MQQHLTRLRHPFTGELPVGFRQPRVARGEVGPQPFYRIAGGDPSNDDPEGDDDDKDKPKFTQAELAAKAAEEKRQGKRAGAREVMERLGFDTIEEAEQFIKDRKADEERSKTDAQKREDALAERERQAEAREKKAAERERTANLRSALIEQGAKGDNLKDAIRLFDVEDDADEDDIAAAAEKLKERRPELFGEAEEPTTKKRSGALPGGKPPKRKNPDGVKAGAAGRAAAERRGFIKSDTKD